MLSRKPGASLIVTAVFVIATCLLMAALGAPLLLHAETPGAFMGAVMIVPFCLLVAAAQFLAGFRANASAARLVTVLCFLVAGFFGFAVLTSAGELIRASGPNPPGIAWMFILFGAIGGCAAAAGFVNRRWGKVLLGPPPIGVCPACAYNLTGNVSGVCPECGVPITTKS